MSDIIWDGITRGSTLHADACAIRHQLANAAKTYDWEETLAILSGNPDLINVSRPDGKSWFAPLHQASHGGAPVEVVRRMLDTGAWRTLRIADGQRPIDIASARRHSHLLKALEPTHKRDVPKSLLSILQRNFHDVIVERAHSLVEEHDLRLPELEPLLEVDKQFVWFAVPGMYGGFRFWLEHDGSEPKLISESWCRVAGGSGQRHEITVSGGTLLDEGFV